MDAVEKGVVGVEVAEMTYLDPVEGLGKTLDVEEVAVGQRDVDSQTDGQLAPNPEA